MMKNKLSRNEENKVLGKSPDSWIFLNPTFESSRHDGLDSYGGTQHLLRASMEAPYLYEKETEYFGFYPIQFVDRVINAANEIIYQSADRFLNILHSSHDELSLISSFQLEEGLLKMLTLWECAVDKNFDLFEMYLLKNIFKFPASVIDVVDMNQVRSNFISRESSV